MQTGKTKKIIREHKATVDAQVAYQNLLILFKSGTTQKLEQERLQKVLRDWKITPYWNNTTESFLTSWSHKLMDYEEMAGVSMSDVEKGRILEATILHHDELHSAVTSASLFETTIASMTTTTTLTGMDFNAFYTYIRA